MLGRRVKRPSHESVANEREEQACGVRVLRFSQSGKFTPRRWEKTAITFRVLFMSPAEAFYTQYWGPVEERVSHLMHELAQAKSASKGSEGTDPQAWMQEYPRFFARER